MNNKEKYWLTKVAALPLAGMSKAISGGIRGLDAASGAAAGAGKLGQAAAGKQPLELPSPDSPHVPVVSDNSASVGAGVGADVGMVDPRGGGPGGSVGAGVGGAVGLVPEPPSTTDTAWPGPGPEPDPGTPEFYKADGTTPWYEPDAEPDYDAIMADAVQKNKGSQHEKDYQAWMKELALEEQVSPFPNQMVRNPLTGEMEIDPRTAPSGDQKGRIEEPLKTLPAKK